MQLLVAVQLVPEKQDAAAKNRTWGLTTVTLDFTTTPMAPGLRGHGDSQTVVFFSSQNSAPPFSPSKGFVRRR